MKTTEDRGRYDRFRNEVMAGGSVTEAPAAEPEGGGWQGALGGLLIIGLLVWLAVVNLWMFVFAVGILISVFLHEAGHFVTARMTGMKATQFFLGFGPRLWSFHRGETEYGVRALPLGAFVRIIGMNNMDEVPPADEARTYRQKSYPAADAGDLGRLADAPADRDRPPVRHLLDARGARRADGRRDRRRRERRAGAGGGHRGRRRRRSRSAAQAIDDPDDLGETVRSHEPGDSVIIVVERDGEQQTVTAVLGANTEQGSDLFGSARLGVSSRTAAEWEEMSTGDAAVSSVTDLIPVTWESTKGIVQVLNPVNIINHLSGESEDLSTRPTTVVGVTQVSGTVGETEGFVGVLYLLAVLNVFVGVFNMFPLLPLDGGHAAVATYERVRERGGRRYFADVSKLMPFAMGVIMVLLALFVSGLYLDITQPSAMKPGSLSERRPTRQIHVGSVPVGGGAPVSVQSMTITKTADVEGTLQQIYGLAAAGCDIVRCTCNEAEAAEGLAQIVPRSPVPIIADIHHQYRMALAALEAGVQGLRLNPGNIRRPEHIKAVAAEARDRQVPIRIGVNGGSLDPALYERFGGVTPEAMVASAMQEMAYFDEVDFDLIKISVKASSVPLMVEAYRQLSAVTDHPLHLGVTEAGPPPGGLVKGTAGIATLLLEGIGDTIRYSLTADPVEEARAGRQLLESLGLRERKNVDLIACPSCGRAEIDVIEVAKRAMDAFGERELPLQVAVMGCVVNGPGEAREADLGIAAGNKRGHLFVKGRNIAVVPEDEMVDSLVEWAEFINEHGIEAAIAKADTARAEREAARDRSALLDAQGADVNHAAEKIVEIRKTVGR